MASGKDAAHHHSVKDFPIRLPDRMWRQKVLLLLPPDPLHHVLIGPPNTLLTLLLKKYPRQMRQFYKSCGLLRRALYGGQCTGEQIKRKLATHTPKCHIAGGHFEQYFKLTGRTLYYADKSSYFRVKLKRIKFGL